MRPTEPHREFCPHGGMVCPPEESPATLAGAAAGDVPTRVRTAVSVALGIWALYGAYATFRGQLDLTLAGIGATVTLGSLGILWLSARAEREEATKKAGALYLIGTSFAIAAAEQHAGLAFDGIVAGVSWNAVWVAFFPLLVPCAPRHTLAKALLGATATPVAYFVARAVSGTAIDAPLDLLALFAPVYVGAAIAYTGAHLLSKIGGQLEVARSIGRYELIRPLGAGGMGEVWEARHRLLARPVALKVVAGDARDQVAKRARFEREARATAALRSPHTVQLFDFGATEDGSLFYAMELLEGMDLEQLVHEHGPQPAERVVHILRQALDSLEEAHSMGLVHRDIKPANLHLGRYGLRYDHLKVLDFGLVKSSPLGGLPGAALGPTLTADDRISGTPAYLAPETVSGDRDVDGRADIYALGCVAYWLLTGERVFPAEDALRAAVAHVTERPIPPRERGARIGRDLEAVILATLEKDPIRRPDAASLREMLETVELEAWTQADARAWWDRSEALPPVRRIEDATPTPRTLVGRPIGMIGHA